jgi:hypothetical protein
LITFRWFLLVGPYSYSDFLFTGRWKSAGKWGFNDFNHFQRVALAFNSPDVILK